jgi:CrcB protein
VRATLTLYAFVALGGAVGAVLRWAMSAGVMALTGGGFPWGTLMVNVIGSAAIGLFARLAAPDGRLLVGPHSRQMVMSGFLGGFTTFSVFSLETLLQLQRGAWFEAGLYVAASLATWLGAVWLGDALGARLNRLKGA